MMLDSPKYRSFESFNDYVEPSYEQSLNHSYKEEIIFLMWHKELGKFLIPLMSHFPYGT